MTEATPFDAIIEKEWKEGGCNYTPWNSDHSDSFKHYQEFARNVLARYRQEARKKVEVEKPQLIAQISEILRIDLLNAQHVGEMTVYDSEMMWKISHKAAPKIIELFLDEILGFCRISRGCKQNREIVLAWVHWIYGAVRSKATS